MQSEEEAYDSNTFLKLLPMKSLYKWTALQHPSHNLVRNQNDSIFIILIFRNGVKSAKTYSGSDVGSKHNLDVIKLKIQLKKLRINTKVNMNI